MAKYLLVFLISVSGISEVFSQNLNTYLMESTFLIYGRTAKGEITTGTVFILGRPVQDDTTSYSYVLITAAHVLEGIAENQASLKLRINDTLNNYKVQDFPIPIRNNGNVLWKRHQTEDVAVMYVALPISVKIPILPTGLLVTDQILVKYGITPGDELLCLGYPLSSPANDAWFPILRSGKISSYPITPTNKYRKMLFDFQVYGGNSGGPVYFISTSRVKQSQLDTRGFQGIIGLVSAQLKVGDTFIEVASVVPSQFILETIEQLPLVYNKPVPTK